jgi:hypothetical protein
MKKVIVTDIKWDTDDLTGLPSSTDMVIPTSLLQDELECDYDDIISDYISDNLSNVFGFTHYGFNYSEFNGES